MNIALESFLVVQPSDEEHFLAEVGQGRQHLAEFHLLSCALGPPLFGAKSVSRKQHGQTYGSLAFGPRSRGSLSAPHRERLHPGQSHRDTRAT